MTMNTSRISRTGRRLAGLHLLKRQSNSRVQRRSSAAMAVSSSGEPFPRVCPGSRVRVARTDLRLDRLLVQRRGPRRACRDRRRTRADRAAERATGTVQRERRDTGATGTVFGGAITAGACGGRGAGSSLVAAAWADWAKRSSSSGFSAPNTNSASRLRLRTSLSLNAKGHSENASSRPITRRRPHKRDRDHGARAQLAAGLQVHSGIGLGVVADHDLRGAEAGAGESGIAIDASADVGSDRARGGAQDNFIIFGQGDGETIRAGDRDGAFRDELQHFIENELLVGLKLGDRSAGIETMCSARPGLFCGEPDRAAPRTPAGPAARRVAMALRDRRWMRNVESSSVLAAKRAHQRRRTELVTSRSGLVVVVAI